MVYVLGLDGGIASLGWALLDEKGQQIVDAGSWCFDPPENPKDRTPTNAIRRQHRGQRRVIRRRRQRMAKLRELFLHNHMIEESGADALRWRPEHDPWTLRAAALTEKLTGLQLALALGHIARHRGFRSNSKRDQGANAPPDTKGMLTAIAANTDRLEDRTVAQLATTDPDWIKRKRNRGDFARTILRQDLEDEVRRIFKAQRALGSAFAAAELQEAFAPLAFDQGRLIDNEDPRSKIKVGSCTHEPSERRTSRFAPSFERFRLLARLRNLRLLTREDTPELTAGQISAAMADFGLKPGLTFKQLRKRLDIGNGVQFAGIPPANEGHDVAARTGDAARGTHALLTTLGETAWRALSQTPEKLDRIAEILTFREDLARIEEGLRETGIDPLYIDLLTEAARAGAFAKFKGAAHISAKTARAVNAGLTLGLNVDKAFAYAGYDHAARAETKLEAVANPVARKALAQMLKQVKTVIHEYRHLFGPTGMPDRIHVELARDIGKGPEERGKLEADLGKRTAAKERAFQELQGRFPAQRIGGEDLLRYELWKEQGGACLYTGDIIPPAGILANDNTYQVDHILPWSRFGDDSFRNKALVSARANQDKKNRTPFEWLGGDARRWEEFGALVQGCKEMSGGKKHGFYLRQNAAEVQEKFRTRNLNDTRYACRALLELLVQQYPAQERATDPDNPKRRVFARPGALTAKLRQVWGLEGRKKGPDGKRLPDDRHHALDAMIVAACSESMLQRLTAQVQRQEGSGQRRAFVDVPEPWPGFREQAHAKLDKVFVARPDRRRARGEAHEATIRRIAEHNEKPATYERKSVDALKEGDLARMKDGDGRNAPIVALLRDWLRAGKPRDKPPISPQGDIIRKIRIRTDIKIGIVIRGGAVKRGEMARVDVFCERRPGKTGKFHLVPIYPHQIVDPLQTQPPNLAISAHKNEANWTAVDGFTYLFSLYQNCLVRVSSTPGEFSFGYYRGTDRDDAKIKIANPVSSQLITRESTKTLLVLEKWSVDRLGRVYHIPHEVRTWHGVACT